MNMKICNPQETETGKAGSVVPTRFVRVVGSAKYIIFGRWLRPYKIHNLPETDLSGVYTREDMADMLHGRWDRG